MQIVEIVLLSLLAQTSLEGRVVKSGSAEPVAKVNLDLRRLDAPASQPLIAGSGDDGRFVFRNVPPGRYQLHATRNGYVPQGLPIAIAADTPVPEIRLAMRPTGAITGRVRDRNGQPVVNADVQAMRATYQEGRRVLTLVQSARTNDLGEYRIFWLPPGQYYVHATPWDGTALGSPVVMNPGQAPIGGAARFTLLAGDRLPPGFRTPGAAPSDSETWPPVYFPGTMNEAMATPIGVRGESTFSGVDITIAPVRPRRVRGVILDAAGQPALSAQLMRSRTPSVGSYIVEQVDSSAGTFDIRGVIPGSYTLVAVAGGLAGRVPLEVGDADLDNVTIQVGPGVDIAGKVSIEGLPASTSAAGLAGLRISLRSDPWIPGMPQPLAAPLADGSFMVAGVLPGDYRVTIQPFHAPPRATMLPSLNRQPIPAPSPLAAPGPNAAAPPLQGIAVSPAVNPLQPMPDLPELPQALQNAYVKSVRLADANVLNSGLRIDRTPDNQLEIVIATDAGTIEGVVLNDRREPVSNVPVALVPDASRQRSDLFKSTTTDAAGRFRLHGIAPGDYKLFSWEDAENGAWLLPDFLGFYEDKVRAARVTEGSRQDIAVEVIPSRN